MAYWIGSQYDLQSRRAVLSNDNCFSPAPPLAAAAAVAVPPNGVQLQAQIVNMNRSRWQRVSHAWINSSPPYPYDPTVLSILRPVRDITYGGWLPTPGSSLQAMTNEPFYSDANYDSSAFAPVGDTMELLLGPAPPFPLDPTRSGLLRVRYQGSVSGGRRVDLTLSLIQGTTILATWTQASIPHGWLTLELAVAAGVVALITDPSNLRLRATATQL